MRALWGIVAVGIALAVAACGGDDESGRQAVRDARRIGDAVQGLERALQRRDFRAICARHFSRALRDRLGGRRCPAQLRRAARGVRSPRIEIEGIALQGRARASVRVVTRAERQAPARDVLVLVRERAGWRVDGLGVMPER
jgi:hypothetical protein